MAKKKSTRKKKPTATRRKTTRKKSTKKSCKKTTRQSKRGDVSSDGGGAGGADEKPDSAKGVADQDEVESSVGGDGRDGDHIPDAGKMVDECSGDRSGVGSGVGVGFDVVSRGDGFVVPQPPVGSHPKPNDGELVKSYLAKSKAGRKPNREENRAYQRFVGYKEHQDRWKYYRSVPSLDMQALLGRQSEDLRRMQAQWGIPMAGKKVDLVAVFGKLANLLGIISRNGGLAKFGVAGWDQFAKEDPDLAGSSKGAGDPLDRYRNAAAEREEIKVQQMLGELVDVETASTIFDRVANVIQQAGETLRKAYGDDAALILEEAIEDALNEVENFYSEGNQNDD